MHVTCAELSCSEQYVTNVTNVTNVIFVMQMIPISGDAYAPVFKQKFSDIFSVDIAREAAVCALAYMIYGEMEERPGLDVIGAVEEVRRLVMLQLGGDANDYAVALTPYKVNFLRFSNVPGSFCYADALSVDEMQALRPLLSAVFPDFAPGPPFVLHGISQR